MSKHCNNPNCGAYKQPQDGSFCELCGQKLVSDEPAQTTSAKTVSADGISVSRVSNDSHDTISNNNTTIVLQGKSYEDLTLNERKASYRKYCAEKIRNGLITPELRRDLDLHALDLGLSQEDRKEIEQLIRRNSAPAVYELNTLDRDNLELIKETVASNKIRINDMLPKLEAMSSADNDEVQYYYNLLLTASSPSLVVRKYTDRELDVYWQTFWAYIGFIKNGQKVKAEQALREMTVWDTQSHDNLYLLQAIGSLLNGDTDTASTFLSRGRNYSYLLGGLEQTAQYLVKNKGQRRFSNSAEVNFYLEKVFGVKKDVPVVSPTREPISTGAPSVAIPRPAVSDKKKGSGGKFLGGLALIAAVVVALVVLPKKKESKPVPQTAIQEITAAETPEAAQQTNSNTTSSAAKTGTSTKQTVKSSGGNNLASGKNNSSTAQATAQTAQKSASTSASSTATSTAAMQVETKPAQTTSTPAVAPKDPIAELKKAADEGDKDAQFNLGMKYYEGKGVTKNYTTAFQYLKPLAEAGYVKAFFPVADMYHRGQGVAKDRAAAEKWYQKAADNGDAKAKSILINSF